MELLGERGFILYIDGWKQSWHAWKLWILSQSCSWLGWILYIFIKHMVQSAGRSWLRSWLESMYVCMTLTQKMEVYNCSVWIIVLSEHTLLWTVQPIYLHILYLHIYYLHFILYLHIYFSIFLIWYEYLKLETYNK